MMNPNTNPLMNATNMAVPPANSSDCNCNSPRTHKVPRMPIMIDQAQANPMDVRAFVGKPLHTVLDADAFDGKMLQIFTSQETAHEFAKSSLAGTKRKRQAATPQPTLTPGVPAGNGYILISLNI